MNLIEKKLSLIISSLKCKTARKKLISVSSSIMDVLTELLRVNKKVEILLDSLHMNSLHFILSISFNMLYRIA